MKAKKVTKENGDMVFSKFDFADDGAEKKKPKDYKHLLKGEKVQNYIEENPPEAKAGKESAKKASKK